MRKHLFFLLLIFLVSCDKSTDYKFFHSTEARFEVYNPSKPMLCDVYYIAVDVYTKTNSSGSTSYAVKNDEGTMYIAETSVMGRSGYRFNVFGEFKYKGRLGHLFFN